MHTREASKALKILFPFLILSPSLLRVLSLVYFHHRTTEQRNEKYILGSFLSQLPSRDEVLLIIIFPSFWMVLFLRNENA